MKAGKLAVLSIAALAYTAAAQDCAVQEDQCHGPDDDQKKVCCPDLECFQKDEGYGQCLPAGATVGNDWMGNVLDYSGLPGAGGEAEPGEEAAEEEVEDAEEEVEDAEEEEMEVEEPEEPEEMEEAVPAPVPAPGVVVPVVIPDEMEVEEDAEMPAMPAMPAVAPVAEVPEMGEMPEMVPEAPEPMADAPAPTPMSGSFVAFAGKDYIPNPLNEVMIEDIMPTEVGSALVDTQAECEEKCLDTEGCNAASYYLDGTQFDNKNCWLKIFKAEDLCTPPTDWIPDPNATFLILETATCVGLADAPGVAPVAAAPVGLPLGDYDDGDAPTDSANTTTVTEDRALGVTPDASAADGIVTLRSATAAMVMASAILFL